MGSPIDPDVMPIYTAVAEGKRPYFSEIVQYSPYTRSLWHQFNSLTIREGVLCRMFEDTLGDPNKIIYQTVVPTALAHPVARVYHVSPFAWHWFTFWGTEMPAKVEEQVLFP